MTSASSSVPLEGVSSFLDTDLYKLTMGCVVLKYFPDVEVTYGFSNRTPHMQLTRKAYRWLEAQIKKLGDIRLTDKEHNYLVSECPFLSQDFLKFLSTLQLKPDEQIVSSLEVLKDAGKDDDKGNLHITIKGRWVDTILYEIPLLALTSEAYFKFCNTDWNHEGQKERAYEKGLSLLESGCLFSEFGTRRRRDRYTQELVLQGLVSAAADANAKGFEGKLTGTSNVNLAMKFGLMPVGTVAHEWFMGVAAILDNYKNATETALAYWITCFGEGVLGIALTDTFGTPEFLKAFRKPGPSLLADSQLVKNVPITKNKKTYAQLFTGVRQDSGNPADFVKLMREFYDQEGIKEKKTIVFSDSLNVNLCKNYKKDAEALGFLPTFGVGTFFTNDFVNISDSKKSAPLNIVIKLSSASGRPAIKISDNTGKNTGDQKTVERVKQELGYTEKSWEGGDEKSRWSENREQ